MQALTIARISSSASCHSFDHLSVKFTDNRRCQSRIQNLVLQVQADGDRVGENARIFGVDVAQSLQDRNGENVVVAPMEVDSRRLKPGSNGKQTTQMLSVSSPLFFGAVPIIYPSLSENTGYSQASYYTSLGLFLLSLPGLWSLIKRSAKSKIVQKTFIVAGPSIEMGKSPSQIAGEITSFFMRNNFLVASRGDTVTFEGLMTPSRGQAAFLTFCSCISLASVALVLTITLPDVGDKWYWLTALSPLAGWYYWTKASRMEEIKVKMVLADDEASVDVIVQGDDEQVDRLRKELKLMEKGMVYVKGVLEQ